MQMKLGRQHLERDHAPVHRHGSPGRSSPRLNRPGPSLRSGSGRSQSPFKMVKAGIQKAGASPVLRRAGSFSRGSRAQTVPMSD